MTSAQNHLQLLSGNNNERINYIWPVGTFSFRPLFINIRVLQKYFNSHLAYKPNSKFKVN